MIKHNIPTIDHSFLEKTLLDNSHMRLDILMLRVEVAYLRKQVESTLHMTKIEEKTYAGIKKIFK